MDFRSLQETFVALRSTARGGARLALHCNAPPPSTRAAHLHQAASSHGTYDIFMRAAVYLIVALLKPEWFE
jgi:hypothetical protein